MKAWSEPCFEATSEAACGGYGGVYCGDNQDEVEDTTNKDEDVENTTNQGGDGETQGDQSTTSADNAYDAGNYVVFSMTISAWRFFY